MANAHGEFIWYELMTPDPDASKIFYDSVVGWTIGATVVHEAANIVRRVLAHDASPLPNFGDVTYWKLVGIRFVGYLVAISVIYLIRRLVLRG